MKWYRRVIQITALDSPNVIEGLKQRAAGLVPDNVEKVPGVLTFAEFEQRLATWNPQRIDEGIYARWYEGAEIKLFPPEWLKASVARWHALRLLSSIPGSRFSGKRQAKAMGVDSGEGAANSSFAVGDDLGLIELVSEKTPDTTDVPRLAVDLGRKHNIPPEEWYFDRGGGGKQHADYLRKQGKNVKTVATGSPPQLELKRGLYQLKARKDTKEEAYTYVSVRVQMAHDFSGLLDPSIHEARVFALPPPEYGPQYAELHRQMRVIPKQTDEKGRFTLPPKQRRDERDTRKTLVEMLGASPDEWDAVCLMCYGMLHKTPVTRAGVAV